MSCDVCIIMKTTDDMVLFWNGPFSQWYPSNFIVDGIEYNCAEQYMMAEKARFFGDESTLEEIMETDEPAEQKRLGRLVSGFDEDDWNEVAIDIVVKGNLAKFSQNKKLKKKLLKTGSRILVEASPEDCIWGIGLAEDDPRALDRHSWEGTNWLGEALSQVRDELTESEG